MRFDIARTVALGCDISMGDHRYPDGHLEPEVYRRLASVYGEVEAMEELLDAARPMTEALLLGSVEAFSGKGLLSPEFTPLTKDAVRVLEELEVQFDLATTADPWPKTDCIIYLGEQTTEPEIRALLQAHVEAGGALLGMDHAISGAGELFPATIVPWEAPKQAAMDNMSNIGHVSTVGCDAEAAGPAGDFIRLGPEFGGEDFPYLLSTPARILQAAEEAGVLAWRHLPVSAKPPFASSVADSPLIVQRGRVIYSSPNLFAEAVGVGSPQPAVMIDALLRRLIPDRLVEHDAGPTVAAHLHDLPGGRLLHLVHWSLDRWETQLNSATTFPTLAEINITLRLDEPVESVVCLPSGNNLVFDQKDGGISFTLPRLHIWQVVCLFVDITNF